MTKSQGITHVLLLSFALTFLASCGQAGGSPKSTQTGSNSSDASSTTNRVAFELDHVALNLQTPFLPTKEFDVAPPGYLDQIAASATFHPEHLVMIMAIPFGSTPGSEALPEATGGGSSTYVAALRAFHTAEGGRVVTAPSLTLFGRKVVGHVALMPPDPKRDLAQSVAIGEWVTESGPRLWLVRVARELEGTDSSIEAALNFTKSLATFSLIASNISAGTSIGEVPPIPPDVKSETILPGTETQGASLAYVHRNATYNLPPWWNNQMCDDGHYFPRANTHASPLSANQVILRSSNTLLAACGPRPIRTGSIGVLVRYFPNAVGEFEFQCTELVTRYLYLQFGTPPYLANGNQIVWNYNAKNGGVPLTKFTNDGKSLGFLYSGAVLSYSGNGNGHTAIVLSGSLDKTGTGWLTVFEENGSATGFDTLTVKNRVIQPRFGKNITGWLEYFPTQQA